MCGFMSAGTSDTATATATAAAAAAAAAGATAAAAATVAMSSSLAAYDSVSRHAPLPHGSIVRRNVEGEWFLGEIIEVDMDDLDLPYLVQYVDGMQEEMSHEDAVQWMHFNPAAVGASAAARDDIEGEDADAVAATATATATAAAALAGGSSGSLALDSVRQLSTTQPISGLTLEGSPHLSASQPIDGLSLEVSRQLDATQPISGLSLDVSRQLSAPQPIDDLTLDSGRQLSASPPITGISLDSGHQLSTAQSLSSVGGDLGGGGTPPGAEPAAFSAGRNDGSKGRGGGGSGRELTGVEAATETLTTWQQGVAAGADVGADGERGSAGQTSRGEERIGHILWQGCP
jgi:hypothetical protein